MTKTTIAFLSSKAVAKLDICSCIGYLLLVVSAGAGVQWGLKCARGKMLFWNVIDTYHWKSLTSNVFDVKLSTLMCP